MSRVQIWKIPLDAGKSDLDKLVGLLDPLELARASSFKQESDREKFILRRGVLRLLLGDLISLDPGKIKFGHGDYGKPYIRTRTPLYFNLSWSNDYALIGVSRSAPLGVDIEKVKFSNDLDSVASSFFTSRESKIVHRLSDKSKVSAFFNCWTRKEAFIKAIGDGLSYPLDSFEVSLAPGDKPELLASTKEDVRLWTLKSIAIEDDYIAAMAIKQKQTSIEIFDWKYPIDVL